MGSMARDRGQVRPLHKGGELASNQGQEFIVTGDRSLRVDIPDTDSTGVIKLEIPEVKKEDVRVTMDNGISAIRGERKQEKKY